MKRYVMALDAGTTSNRCILFDEKGTICRVAQQEFRQIFPQPGWVEHDAKEIWQTQLQVAREALQAQGVDGEAIAAIGITNQRETTVVWDRETGEPVYNAIVWQCRRTAEVCDRLRAEGRIPFFHERTGLLPDAYFSATKLKWILDEVPGARERAQKGELLFGTIDTWLIWNLTGGKAHVTDVSNASRTMLCDLRTLTWDEEILALFDIPACMLPQIVASSEVYGMTDPALFGTEIPVAGAAGDQQAALFGQACFEKGEAKNTYGTGGFLLLNTGEEPVFSKKGLLTTVAWKVQDKVQYALEGSVFIAGAAIQWLRDEIGLFASSPESEAMARQVEDTNGCYVVPAFTGLGAPYWNPHARGIITGLTRGVNRNHLTRATLESLAFQTCDVLEAMTADGSISLQSLRADGGASANDLLLQMQADLCRVPIVRPSCIETTALGAAYLAGLAVGYWDSQESLREHAAVDRVFTPQLSDTEWEEKRKGWQRAVQAALYWASGE